MKTCISNKKLYSTQELAEDALIEARSKFDFGAQQGPIGVYHCEDCGCYHLTSQGKMNARLEQQIKEGKIQLQKEANHWLDKLKHRKS